MVTKMCLSLGVHRYFYLRVVYATGSYLRLVLVRKVLARRKISSTP